MTYKVIRRFADMEDDGRIYEVGDEFPHPDVDEVSEERIKELATSRNKIGKPLIEKVPLWTQISYDNGDSVENDIKPQPTQKKANTGLKKPVKGKKKED